MVLIIAVIAFLFFNGAPKTASTPILAPPAPEKNTDNKADTTSTPATPIGKTAYARRPGVTVYTNDSGSAVYKVAKQGEWIGTINDVAGTDGWLYRVNGNYYVPVGDVITK